MIPGTTKPDFSRKVGGYTGAYGKGEAGNLYVSDPVEGRLYTFGQKDYRGGKTERGYTRYENGNSMKWIPGTCAIKRRDLQ